MRKYRVHFEPEDVECDNIEQVEEIINLKKKDISVRKIVLVDEHGFPIEYME